jgi:hypothetical protein
MRGPAPVVREIAEGATVANFNSHPSQSVLNHRELEAETPKTENPKSERNPKSEARIRTGKSSDYTANYADIWLEQSGGFQIQNRNNSCQRCSMEFTIP